MKKCSKCKTEKSLNAFGKNKARSSGLNDYCRSCVAEYAKSPQRKASKAKWRLMNRYGITCDDYKAMLEKQEGRCDICGIHNDDLPDALCVDHDHTTSKVRGLLCKSCNLALGNMRDNPKLLQKAAKYLTARGY